MYISNIVKTLKEWEKRGTLSSGDKMELSNDLKALSEFFLDFKGIQQGEINKWKEKEQKMLLESLHSKILLYRSPSHKVYKDSSYLETKELIKNL